MSIMGERNASSIGHKKSLFYLFSITSILFILSWLFVLRSTGHPYFIDHNLLPNHKLFSTFHGGNLATRSRNGNNDPSIAANPVILEDQVAALRGSNMVKANPDNKAVLKVFMYDLPPEFHFELLDWKPEGKGVWPDIRTKVPEYPGGLNLQHSIEYWLTLDLLASEFADPSIARSAIRVHNSSVADVVFVPFFSSLSYNRYSRLKPHQKGSTNKLLQQKLVKFLVAQEEWKRSGGRDHIVLAHHPNSLLDARMKLWPATFILSDFGRYPPNVANVDKDVIAPYKHVIRTFVNDSSDFDSRPTLLYFQGAIYRKDGGFARQELFYLLKDEKDVHFSFGTVLKDGIRRATQGMHSSKFCLNIAGDTPSSNRLFDAIASHCVPVIISDDIELPYEDVLDYSEFCVFVRTSDAVKEKFLINLIRSIGRDDWTRMWARLKEVENLFEFQYPSKEGDAVQMIWQAVARKVPAIRMKIHKSRRFSRYNPLRNRKPRSLPIPINFSK
ncbi:probable arabinosyltransferase ARAD1 [Rhododendron vialii]|uniref:probable arabinosyltransferase ARAD1 n=1 Tax=Rhododendron vialii TaxID=182163 RepID=UPI0026602741|nr:probable arabinosyltransferase ARAD1 [Rhododendron vialii]